MRRPGFTLVELIVVVAIIALLTAMSVVGFTQQQRRARDARRIADLGSIGLALENYRTIRGDYPAQTTGGQDGGPVENNLGPLVDEGLINTLPREPKPLAAGGEYFCRSYTYAKSWEYSGPGDTSLGYYVEPLGNTGLPKRRAYMLYARTELAGTSEGRHPLDQSVYATIGQSWCGGSGYAILAGPKI